jgi:acetoin utilization protein AcuB
MTSKLITVKHGDSVKEAFSLMRGKGIRHLPVRDNEEKIIGILSERDVQRALNVKKAGLYEQEITLDENLKVEDFMSWPVYMVSEETSIERVAEEMLAQKISAFLVVDQNRVEKGIVTTDDMLKYLLTYIKTDQPKMKFEPLSWFREQVKI